MEGETVDRAAVRVLGVVWSVDPPGRHHDVFRTWWEAHPDLERKAGKPSMRDQGFVTSAGRFVDRWEAFQIARDAGQIGDIRATSRLFSEDLW